MYIKIVSVQKILLALKFLELIVRYNMNFYRESACNTRVIERRKKKKIVKYRRLQSSQAIAVRHNLLEANIRVTYQVPAGAKRLTVTPRSSHVRAQLE